MMMIDYKFSRRSARQPVVQIDIKDEAHWHALRAEHIGASEMAGLIMDEHGVPLHPSLSPFLLWHKKMGTAVEENSSNNERMQIGNDLEAGVAKGVARKYALTISDAEFYLVNKDYPWLGCSLDYLANTQEGVVPFEIKTISNKAFYSEWGNGLSGWGGPEGWVPPHINIQLQHQMLMTNSKLAILGACRGVEEYIIYVVEKDPVIHKQIKDAASEFQKAIEEGIEPECGSPCDLKTIKAVSERYAPPTEEEEACGLTEDEEALLNKAYLASRAKSKLTKHYDGFKAKIIQEMGNREYLIGEDVTARLKATKAGLRFSLTRNKGANHGNEND